MKNSIIIILLLLFKMIYGNNIFVINSSSETLSKINLNNNIVDNVFAVLGEIPNKMEFYDNKIYVVNSGDNSLQIVDMVSGVTLGNIFIENSSNPYDIVIHQEFAYVTGMMLNKVYKINLITNNVEDWIYVGNNPNGLAIINNILYVGNTDFAGGYNNCSISKIDLNLFAEIERFSCGVNPQYLSAIDNKLHISCNGNWDDIYGQVQIWNPETDEFEVELSFEGYYTSNIIPFDDFILVGDTNGSSIFRYSRSDYSILNGIDNPITPGAQLLTKNSDNIFSLNGTWGQNFHVNKFDDSFDVLQSYEVALYGTDVKYYGNDVTLEEDVIAQQIVTLENSPNPFNPTTTISFDLKADTKITLAVFNIKGQKIKNLFAGYLKKGKKSFVWSGKNNSGIDVSSGIYYVKLNVDNKIFVKKNLINKIGKLTDRVKTLKTAVF